VVRRALAPNARAPGNTKRWVTSTPPNGTRGRVHCAGRARSSRQLPGYGLVAKTIGASGTGRSLPAPVHRWSITRRHRHFTEKMVRSQINKHGNAKKNHHEEDPENQVFEQPNLLCQSLGFGAARHQNLNDRERVTENQFINGPNLRKKSRLRRSPVPRPAARRQFDQWRRTGCQGRAMDNIELPAMNATRAQPNSRIQ